MFKLVSSLMVELSTEYMLASIQEKAENIWVTSDFRVLSTHA